MAQDSKVIPATGAEVRPEKKRDIFEDPAIAAASRDDPFARFISENWRTLLTILIAIPVVGYGVQMYRSTNESKYAAASRLFGEIRDQYEQLSQKHAEVQTVEKDLASLSGTDAEKETKSEELSAKLKVAQAAVTETKQRMGNMATSLADYGSEPFPRLAQLYKALAEAKTGNIQGVPGALGSLDWEKPGKAGSEERLFAESAALLVGRLYLDDPARRAEGREILKGLVSKGDFGASSAGLALAAVAQSPEEKQEVLALLEGLKSRAPEQEKFISEEIERLKT